MMRAVLCRHAGGPEVLELEEVPDPSPAAGQVLVKVSAASITFVETQARAGIPGAAPAEFPIILGNGVSGTVIAVGAGVDDKWVSQAVVTATGGSGGYAELATADEADLHSIPDSLDQREAVALLADGRTAMALIRGAALTSDDRVLITAGAGGVGTLLIQLAKAAGVAQIVALAGGQRKTDVAKDLGADAAIDYTDPQWPTHVRKALAGGEVDVAFDGVGGNVTTDIGHLLAPGARYIPHGRSSGAFGELPSVVVTERQIVTRPLGSLINGPKDNFDLVEAALESAALGQIRPVIGQTLPLDQAAEAHRAIDSRRTIGKSLLVP